MRTFLCAVQYPVVPLFHSPINIPGYNTCKQAVFFRRGRTKTYSQLELSVFRHRMTLNARQSRKAPTALLTRREMCFPLQCAQEHPKGIDLAQYIHERGGESIVK